mgnify:CR=1 FL=1
MVQNNTPVKALVLAGGGRPRRYPTERRLLGNLQNFTLSK